MGVGSIGQSLDAYDDGDTFLSVDAGLSWRMVSKGAHKYEFGDEGSILVLVDDEKLTSEVKYSLDLGKTWSTYDMGITLRARALVTLPDSTSQKFLLLGQVPRTAKTGSRVVIVYLDFAPTRKRKCGEKDFVKWYARPPGSRACLMGHKVRHTVPVPSTGADVAFSNGTNVGQKRPIVILGTSFKIQSATKRTVNAKRRTSNGASVSSVLFAQGSQHLRSATTISCGTAISANLWALNPSLLACAARAVPTRHTSVHQDSARFLGTHVRAASSSTRR